MAVAMGFDKQEFIGMSRDAIFSRNAAFDNQDAILPRLLCRQRERLLCVNVDIHAH